MYLKKIKIFFNQSVGDNIYRSHFDFHVFFIGYYLSHQLTKIKFITDGTFDSINIVVGEMSKAMEIINKGITYFAIFNSEVYNRLDDYDRCIYIMGILREALIVISRKKLIPLNQLLNDCSVLRKSGFVYLWNFCNIKVTDLDLRLKFNCELSTYDFKLNTYVCKVGEKKSFCEGCVIRTKPDDVFFSLISKKVQHDNGQLIFTTKWDVPLFYLNISDLNKGLVKTVFSKSPYPEDFQATKNFLQLQNELKYNNDNFK